MRKNSMFSKCNADVFLELDKFDHTSYSMQARDVEGAIANV